VAILSRNNRSQILAVGTRSVTQAVSGRFVQLHLDRNLGMDSFGPLLLLGLRHPMAVGLDREPNVPSDRAGTSQRLHRDNRSMDLSSGF